MTSITFQKELIELIPEIKLGYFQCNVNIRPSGDKIKQLSGEIISKVRSELTIEEISQKPTIKSTKDGYRKLGKDPSRYRPSAEALTRRIVNGKDLYWINNIVDLLNLISLETGFSIGGYDVDKISGSIEFGIGRENEPYEAIGRGELNIENLPVFRDDLGAFGSPTSDSLRSMVTEATKNFLMIIIDFGNFEILEKTLKYSVELYTKFGEMTSYETKVISSKGK